mgnify:FL=1
MPGFLNILKGIVGGNGETAKVIGDIVDKATYTKQEKAEDTAILQKEIEEAAYRAAQLDALNLQRAEENYLKEIALDLENTTNARSREIEITKIDKASWLQRNITPILALVIILFTFTMWTLILFRNYEPKTNESMIIGGLTSITATVIGYYFGSSIGSKEKDNAIKKLSE